MKKEIYGGTWLYFIKNNTINDSLHHKITLQNT